MWKHKNASISLTVRDRAISSKFSTPRVKVLQIRKLAEVCTLWVLVILILYFSFINSRSIIFPYESSTSTTLMIPLANQSGKNILVIFIWLLYQILQHNMSWLQVTMSFLHIKIQFLKTSFQKVFTFVKIVLPHSPQEKSDLWGSLHIPSKV